MSNLSKRHASEKRFRIYGIAAIGAAVLAMVVLIGTITVRAIPAFVTTEISMDVFFDPEIIDPEKTGKREEWLQADYNAMVLQSLRKIFPRVRNRRDRRNLLRIMSSGGGDRLRNMVVSQPAIIGKTMTVAMPASDDIDMLMKGKISRDVPEDARRLSNKQLKWLDALQAKGHVHTTFNTQFFTSGDSREPELAGIWASVVGSVLTLTITLLLSFPLGVSAAIYLEEFAPKNRWTDLIEVNINNLAAVPSIVFGLLGLAVFLSFFGLPRSAPLVGGFVLALMTLPTIIITARAAMGAVPPSIREAAVGLGASPLQVVSHHVLPLAMPGILTGSIIGMARALGETAPLLMIGMVAFIVDIPKSFTDTATVLPVQVYLWADSPERAFVEKTAAATLVLIIFLIAMNGLAVYLRKKFERRW
ncbi:MAG: phosphate ABC transporter permease PstA [Rhodospirillales bacterium]|jgi:phosphate transport system permease protein|nr:phosphate ABC transporter permease PstA [Rhodospirillales bacterium]MBT4005579.1 phosphate ABC transporter permease PstA [Rhodospirillales bacterium]MBT5076789.1 phosphate ABC transporter permease PstA [Rhodospirillales bacterium]MBT5112298.1 phosphate ABC transporter permease PstA [Rhodospirillales bacterium]MBT5671999.1 phosphate ABC transporter permease PstA [Rhodospirillales bacterium]